MHSMKYKLAVLSSCHKDMLALAIISMGVLQDTLPILYFEALSTENILRDIANKAIWRTTRVDPKSCRGDFYLCGNFIQGFCFTFKAITYPVTLKMF